MSSEHHDRNGDPGHAPPGDDILAGEYVLGVLDAQARQAFAARLPREPALEREVDAWARRLAPLLEDIEPVAPPLSLWPRIRAHLGLSPPAVGRDEADAAVPLWQRLGFWRGFSAAAFAATAASLVALMVAQRPLPDAAVAPHPITLVATIANAAGAPAFMTAVDADACTLVVMPMAGADVPAGKVPELWVIAADGRPHSLGVGDGQRSRSVIVPPALRAALLKAATVMAVSLEPPGGSPTGAPTGAVIGQGALVLL